MTPRWGVLPPQDAASPANMIMAANETEVAGREKGTVRVWPHAGGRFPDSTMIDVPVTGEPAVRLARGDDAESIRSIYNAEVTGSTATLDMVERTPEDQRRWMDEHHGAYPVVVAEDAGRVVAFGSLSPYRQRPGYSGTVEDSVYVAAGYRGRGVGRAVLSELLRLAGVHGFHSVLARIGGGGDPSVGLHEACGFTITGIEKEVGRKHGRWIDVTVMQRMV